jgi:hypothetical protein
MLMRAVIGTVIVKLRTGTWLTFHLQYIIQQADAPDDVS